MVQVTVHKDEPLERALRRFKKKFEKAGIMKDIRQELLLHQAEPGQTDPESESGTQAQTTCPPFK
ncbi:MAG: 30S ribosomal protein S21 [Candidatus Marinimicrobia bacterium]|nr:30S ribosomal protein S21 [Candidatus Neomarinimicrobiota bacterium]